ncbi:ABC transporter permease [Alicyclobacillus mengziensis]|uniref:ABC transporter permease n=1 Tax=Alicyclobacillus mengziensis TaxID=2931921 RepID=A0A9X7VZD0_9BACL|nr:ABC transporter permease [Alicyclobacillus mengziensis]QSO47826.1 ABC transporter permease [Alicyclobacillus mengziensis]
MAAYTMRRILEAIPLLFLITIVTYLLMSITPGGPLAVYLHNPKVTPAQIQALEVQMGLNKPWYIQYFDWLWALLHGNWGYSYFSGLPVMKLIGQRLPNTLILMGAAFILSLGLGLPLGIYVARHQYSFRDHALSFFSFFAWAMPSFFFGVVLQTVFAVDLHWLPVSGMYTAYGPHTFLDLLRHLILPATVLGLGSLASWSRFVRAGILDVLHKDFIRTAHAKGLSERVVIVRHALKNALLPIITIIGMDLPGFFGGAVITEQIFSWPGMGRLFLSSLNNRDYPVQMAGLLIGAMLLILGNLLADLAYGFLDPRIKYD